MISKPRECNIRRISHLNQIIRLKETEYYIYMTKPDFVKFTCNKKQLHKFINESMMITSFDPQCIIEVSQSFLSEHTNAPITNIRKFSYPLLAASIADNDLIEKEKRTYNLKPIPDLEPELTDLHEEIKKIQIYSNQQETPQEYAYTVELAVLITFYSSILICLCIINLYFRYRQFATEQWNRTRNSILNTTNV